MDLKDIERRLVYEVAFMQDKAVGVLLLETVRELQRIDQRLTALEEQVIPPEVATR